ncbi:MAG: hypothetical protein CM15mP93_12740 [Thiotrichaceae bacterium]|nr:MAG: hypothetical protein CM15mP93_12740 [Thiotrichaceae bacterium]
MNKFKTFKSIAIPLIRNNIDTDAIIPKQYLKAVSRQGFGNFLFYDWRYKDPGDLDVEISKEKKDDFILNKRISKKLKLLLVAKTLGVAHPGNMLYGH